MTITFRAVIELLGKPKEHIQDTLQEYIAAIKKNPKYKILVEEIADPSKHGDTEDLWSVYVELEIKANETIDVLHFCFDYMPSVIEILEPQEITTTDVEFGSFLNDLQTRLHQIDMMAKQIKGERDIQAELTATILRNFLLFILRKNNYEVKMLSTMTGVAEKPLGKFLDALVKEEILQEKAGFYTAAPIKVENKLSEENSTTQTSTESNKQ